MPRRFRLPSHASTTSRLDSGASPARAPLRGQSMPRPGPATLVATITRSRGRVFSQGAHDLLGAPVGVGLDRQRVDLGGVDEVDAALEREVQQRVRLAFGVLRREGHRAEADARDFGVLAPSLFARSIIGRAPRMRALYE